MKRFQRNSQPLRVIELTFESESAYQFAVSHGLYISNMHFKVERKITKTKLLQC